MGYRVQINPPSVASCRVVSCRVILFRVSVTAGRKINKIKYIYLHRLTFKKYHFTNEEEPKQESPIPRNGPFLSLDLFKYKYVYRTLVFPLKQNLAHYCDRHLTSVFRKMQMIVWKRMKDISKGKENYICTYHEVREESDDGKTVLDSRGQK